MKYAPQPFAPGVIVGHKKKPRLVSTIGVLALTWTVGGVAGAAMLIAGRAVCYLLR